MNKTTSLQKNYGLIWITFQEKYNAALAELKGTVAAIKGPYSIRKIKPSDNSNAKTFIQKTLLERGGVGFDQLYYDKDLVDLHASYDEVGACFWVLFDKEEVVGTIGLRTDSNTSVGLISKFYLKPEASVHAVSLIKVAQSFAKRQGAKLCTLEIEMRDQLIREAIENSSFELSKSENSAMYYTCQF